MAYKKILVCLDGSPLAEAALPHAQILASDEQAEILLLRISVNPAAEFSFSDPSLADNFIQEMESETLSRLQSARGKLQKAGLRTSFGHRIGLDGSGKSSQNGSRSHHRLEQRRSNLETELAPSAGFGDTCLS